MNRYLNQVHFNDQGFHKFRLHYILFMKQIISSLYLKTNVII